MNFQTFLKKANLDAHDLLEVVNMNELELQLESEIKTCLFMNDFVKSLAPSYERDYNSDDATDDIEIETVNCNYKDMSVTFKNGINVSEFNIYDKQGKILAVCYSQDDAELIITALNGVRHE